MKHKGHQVITKTAIESLSPSEQNWLGKEKEFLIEFYSSFPDYNWPWMGNLTGDSGDPNAPRLPDIRREWDVSYYCGRDPVTGNTISTPGKDILPQGNPPFPFSDVESGEYVPMGSYDAPEIYMPRIMKALEAATFEDGIRILGVLLHHIQDRGAFHYWPDLHKVGNMEDYSLLTIKDYSPEMLGDDLDTAIAGLKTKMKSLSDFCGSISLPLRESIKNNDNKYFEETILAIHQNAARVSADLIYTVIQLADCEHCVNFWGYALGPSMSGNPTMLNLLENSDFEKDDGSNYPKAWVAKYHNLKDRVCRAEWIKSSNYSIFSKNVRKGTHAVNLMWTPEEGAEWIQRWPSAIKVNPNENYSLSGWLKTVDATGQSYLSACFYDGIKMLTTRKSAEFAKNNDWTKVNLDFSIPENIDRLRVSCRSDNNKGAVWFDDLELYRKR
jgi:hypothetical protein